MLYLTLLACQNGSETNPTDAVALPGAPLPAQAPASAHPSGVVATWNGGQLNYDELLEKTSTQRVMLEIEFLQGRYNLENQALEEAAIYAILEAEAAGRGTDVDGLMKLEIEDKVAPPTPDEVTEFYPVISRQLRNAPLEQVRPQVEAALMNRRQGERMSEFIEELRVKYNLQTQLPYPDLPRVQVSADDDPFLGPADAPVTIIEFADYNCGYCRKVYPTLTELVAEYDGKVRVVYRDYPLSGGQGGLEPQVAGNCAGEQDKFWPMHEKLMSNGNYAQNTIDGYVTELQLDPAAFAACQANMAAHYTEIMNDFEAGRKAGVSGTPAFYINGVFLNGAVPKEQFQAVIDKELSAG